MQWPPTVSFPYNAGYVARQRLPIRHYPHRDPVQLERRCRLRAIMMADAENRSNWTFHYHYWQEREWRKFITPDDLPELRYWEPGTELPDPGFTNHLRPWPIRTLQRMVHACCLPVLDRILKDPDTRAHIPNESLHLGEFQRVCEAEALLLARLGAMPR